MTKILGIDFYNECKVSCLQGTHTQSMEVDMKQRNGIKDFLGEFVKGGLLMCCCRLEVMGAYPCLPAFFAVTFVEGQTSAFIVIGALLGMFYQMSLEAIVKYVFVLLTIAVGIRLYIWSNHYSNGWVAAAFAGGATIAMHYASNAFFIHHNDVLLRGVFEGLIVFGLTVVFRFRQIIFAH